MARFSRTALQTGIPFAVLMYPVLLFISGGSLGSTIPVAVAAGVMFGLLIAAFVEYQHRKFAGHDPTDPGEKLLMWGGANHWKGKESVGGYLYLTDERLVFISHKVNIQNHKLSIPLEEISSVRPCQTLVVVPNGMEVVRGQDKERFVIHNRRGWIGKLQERLPRHSR